MTAKLSAATITRAIRAAGIAGTSRTIADGAAVRVTVDGYTGHDVATMPAEGAARAAAHVLIQAGYDAARTGTTLTVTLPEPTEDAAPNPPAVPAVDPAALPAEQVGQACGSCGDAVTFDTTDGTWVGSDGEVTCTESDRPHGLIVSDVYSAAHQLTGPTRRERRAVARRSRRATGGRMSRADLVAAMRARIATA